jgi:anti-sigma factor RsiW
MLGLRGHLGSQVSALVDGQLDEESTERAWGHVLHCPACRRQVEREGWVKRQLTQMSCRPVDPQVPDRLLGSLYQLAPAGEAWAAVEQIEARGRTRRRAGIALVGAGSVSVAVFGLSSLAGAGLGAAPVGTPAASLTRATAPATPAAASRETGPVLTPVAAVHGRLQDWMARGVGTESSHAVAVNGRR